MNCPEHLNGTYVAWPCELPENHDGPHMAKENHQSVVRRQQWLESKESGRGSKGSDVKVREAVEGLVQEKLIALNIDHLNDPAKREQAMLDRLKSVETLPQDIKNLILGQFAMVSLGSLWHLAQTQFAAGADAVILSPEFLRKMMTQPLIDLFEALARAEREGS